MLLEQIDENFAGENLLSKNEAEIPLYLLVSLTDRLNKSFEDAQKPEYKECKAALREMKKRVKMLVQQKEKFDEYNAKKLKMPGNQNNYSKIYKNLTFMYKKGDVMRNGQTNTEYNFQMF